jgi:hypothetical protein
MISFATCSTRYENGVVRRPQPADVLADALRGAYGDAHPLPADMARLLRALDRHDCGR